MGEESKRMPGNWKNGRPVLPMESKDGGIKTKSSLARFCYLEGKDHHLLYGFVECCLTLKEV